MRAPIEGDYLRVKGGTYMAVKAVVHPPGRVIAIPKYADYGSVGLEGAYAYLKEHIPEALLFDDHAGQVIPQIPLSICERHISAREGLSKLKPNDVISSAALELIELLKEHGGLDPGSIGISGSLLLGTQKASSDIDLVFYSTKSAEVVLEAFKRLRSGGAVKAVSHENMGDIAAKRSDSPLSMESWMRHESRKLLYGVFRGMTYSAKIVPLPEEFWEPYGSRRWRELGQVVVRARVVDDARGAFTPNAYEIEVREVLRGRREAIEATEAVSHRSRFAEQAVEGEEVVIAGRLEVDLRSWEKRIFVGNDLNDFIARADYL